jgi:hypothetical protein
MSTTADWAGQLECDASLRDFVAARIAQAGIDVEVARAEAAHWRRIATHLDEHLKELRKADKKATNRARQTRRRRRHAFVSLYPEGPTTSEVVDTTERERRK